MPNYRVKMQSTAHATITVAGINVAASSPRRAWIWDIVVGSEADSADNEFLHQFQRITTLGTVGAATAAFAMDGADVAATLVGGQGVYSGEPTYTANAIMLLVPLNQRATFRWQVDPRDGYVLPATASNGIGIKTPTMTALVVSYSIGFQE